MFTKNIIITGSGNNLLTLNSLRQSDACMRQ